MSRANWTTQIYPAIDDAVTVHVYGEDDDALRIVAELADGLGSSEQEAAATCLSPESSWSKRQKAVKYLLDQRRGDDATRPLVVVDLDALPASVPDKGEDRWADRSFQAARSWIRTLLLTHASASRNVTFVRPRPTHSLTNQLDVQGIVCADGAENEPADTMPYCKPLAEWLQEQGVLSQAAFGHWVRTVDEPELSQLVINAAYDSLTPEARATVGRLAVLRGPQPINGVAGPFRLDGSAGSLTLSPEQVDELRIAGWLQPAVFHDGFVLPNALRAFAKQRATLIADPRADHLAIARAWYSRIETLGVQQAIETHHHAIESGDSELAIKTGRYFLNDLRRLAIKLSVHSEKHGDAATLYRAIIEVDPDDAYAHEYLAYNLQQQDRDTSPTDEILEHFDTARRLEPGNPLFHGRWLTCRAIRGDDVTTELKRQIRRFYNLYGLDAVSYLARTPLRNMELQQRKEVARDCRWLLEGDPNLRALLP